MNRIHLNDDELELVRHALKAYLMTFGHGEAETVEDIKRVLARFRRVEHVEHPAGV